MNLVYIRSLKQVLRVTAGISGQRISVRFHNEIC